MSRNKRKTGQWKYLLSLPSFSSITAPWEHTYIHFLEAPKKVTSGAGALYKDSGDPGREERRS